MALLNEKPFLYVSWNIPQPRAKGSPAIWDNMDGPWGHYVEREKLNRERQIWYDLTYMWNPKKAELTENRE